MQSQPRNRRTSRIIEVVVLVGVLGTLGFAVFAIGRPNGAATMNDAATAALQEATAPPEDTAVPVPTGAAAYPAPTMAPSSLPQPSASITAAEEPLLVTVCGLRETNIKFLVDNSITIVRGIVKHVPPARWSTPNGQRPANPHAPDRIGIIYRPVILQVEEYLKGDMQQRTEVLLARGGTVGQDSVDYCGDPLYTFQEGEHVVLFLDLPEEGLGPIPPETPGGPPLLTIREHYTLTADGQARNIDRQVPFQQLRDEIQAASHP
jgi:hypothetical protein